MIKRFLAVLIAAVFLVACTPAPAADENGAFRGATVSILGDSISTYAGWIPTADGVNREHAYTYPREDLLTDVTETWWYRVIDGLGAKLGVNDSWRGAMVTGAMAVTTGDTGGNSAYYNLTRIRNLGSNGTPDVVIIYGGTNDYGNLDGLGGFDPDLLPGAVDLDGTFTANLAEAYAQTILRIRYFYPEARIVSILPGPTAKYYGDDRLAEGNAILAAVCERYSVDCVDPRDFGLTLGDLPDGIHPGPGGMKKIADAVTAMLLGD